MSLPLFAAGLALGTLLFQLAMGLWAFVVVYVIDPKTWLR